MRHVLTVSFLLAAATAMFAAAEIGKPAPDFTATDINGKTHKLADYKGKIVVLEAYNLDCPFCRHQFKTGAIQELQAELTAKGVVWFLVNSTNPKHPSYRTLEKARQEWAAQKIKATAWLGDNSVAPWQGLWTEDHAAPVRHRQGRRTFAYQGAIDDRRTEGDPRTATTSTKR